MLDNLPTSVDNSKLLPKITIHNLLFFFVMLVVCASWIDLLTIRLFRGNSASLMLGPVAGMLWIIYILSRRKVRLPSSSLPCLFLVMLLMIWSITSLLWTGDPTPRSFQWIRGIAFNFIFFLILISTVKTFSQWKKLLFAFILTGLISIILTFIFSVTDLNIILGKKGWKGYSRIMGVMAGTNYLTIRMGILLPLTFAFWDSSHKKHIKLISFITFVSGILLVGLTLSRTGYLIILLMLLLFFYYGSRRRRISLLKISVSVILVSILIFALTNHQLIIQRFQSLYNPEMRTTGSLNARWNLLLAAGRMFSDHILTGVGIGKFEVMSVKYGAFASQSAHNTYLQIAAELGIIGLITFVGFFYFTAYYLGQLRKFCMFHAKRDYWILTGVHISLLCYLFSLLFLTSFDLNTFLLPAIIFSFPLNKME